LKKYVKAERKKRESEISWCGGLCEIKEIIVEIDV
jgi:hypothetical protein